MKELGHTILETSQGGFHPQLEPMLVLVDWGKNPSQQKGSLPIL